MYGTERSGFSCISASLQHFMKEEGKTAGLICGFLRKQWAFFPHSHQKRIEGQIYLRLSCNWFIPITLKFTFNNI